MPLFSHHHRPTTTTTTTTTSSYTSKPAKPHRPISSPTPNKLFIYFSIFSLIIGIVGISFSIHTLRKTQPLPVFRCRKAEDTLRELHSVTRSRKLGSGSGGTGLGVGGGGGGVLVERTKLLGFVGIQTGFDSGNRREALRSTWFPSDPDGILGLEQATGLSFRFVIGRSKDAKKMAGLRKEVDKYKDFLLIDVDEDYAKLPYKTLAYLKAAFELFDADYYVKAGDDIYLRPDRLATLLAKERTHSRTYIGCMKKGPVVTDPKMKWYEKSGNLLGKEYFLHAYGPMYILSAEVVASLAVTRNDSLRMFSNEDVTIGSWMLSMNVHHEDNRAICDSQCTPTSIAVWDIPKCSGLCNPASKIKELHQIDMCSKSPTLPPDEEEE